jgi:carbonic anhydrase/acetyltransferase-like protein (isoleucine patch superfamily)
MVPTPPHDVEALQQRLERLGAALGQTPLAPAPPQPPAMASRGGARRVGRGGLGLALALVAVGVATSTPALFLVAGLLGLLSAALLVGGAGEAVLSSLPAGLAPKDATRPHVGLGATVADDAVVEPGATVEMGASIGSGAVVEPGATVEMGASVGSGAVVKRGAVVRMRASVQDGAVLEEGAVVGWGVDVCRGAVVGRNAVVGAGATVHAEARVPPGTRMLPGATWSRGMGARAAPGSSPAASAADPREARLHAACARIEDELQQAPASVRELLGASEQTARALRDTCLGLLARERLLRAECAPEALAFLEQERAALEQRIAQASDAVVRRSLQQALAALDEQRRQRGLLRQSAERLEAELTRLTWTLEGMGAQLVRLRTAGLEAARAPDAEVLHSMQQLHEEIDAITEALEHVARGEGEQEPPGGMQQASRRRPRASRPVA